MVDTGSVQCLVKMYKHAIKHEMRIDNPNLVTQFLAGYTDGNPDAKEIRQLQRENATLEEYNRIMEAQVEELQRQIEQQQRSPGNQDPEDRWPPLALARQEDMSLDEFYARMCGNEAAVSTGEVLVNLLRPEFYKDIDQATEARISQDQFARIVDELPGPVLSWLQQELVPRLESVEMGEAPFQKELMKAIVDSGLLPHDTFLDHLLDLLEALAAGPKEAPPPAIAEAIQHLLPATFLALAPVCASDCTGVHCEVDAADAAGLLQGTPTLGRIRRSRRQAALQQESHRSPNFGPNVIVIEPGETPVELQAKLLELYNAYISWDEPGQFGNHRTAVFLKPGVHQVDILLPYYFQVLGLGASPLDTIAKPGPDGIGLEVGQQPGGLPNTTLGSKQRVALRRVKKRGKPEDS
eukprot:g32357.t1